MTTSARDLEGLLERTAGGLVAAGCPGVVLRAEQGPTRIEVAQGWADEERRRPVRPGAGFRIASVTKSVTAVTALLLSQAGELSLDDPVADVLPASLLRRLSSIPGHAGLGRLTTTQLLQHTSGLRDYFFSDRFAGAVGPPDGTRGLDPVDLVEAGLQEGPPLFAPGNGWSYNDTGFALAGLVMQEATGRPLHQLYRQRVLAPLGLGATWLEHAEPARRDEPTTASFDGRRPVGPAETRRDWAGGGLVSTATDLARFVRGVHGDGLLDHDHRRRLTAWRPVEDPRYDGYGLGTGRTVVHGEELLGHTGAWGAFAYWWPSRDAVLTGTVNRRGVDRRPVLAALVDGMRG
jgi:D-alanyl-D-alanine carboxypeptidase